MSSERYLNEAALDPAPETSWGKLLALVPPRSRVLDVGCGHGAFAASLRRLRKCSVTGLERNAAYAADARDRCDALLVGDVETLLRDGAIAAEYDVIIAGDVLEHLLEPAAVLKGLRAALVRGGMLLASVPNVSHLSVVAALAMGRFPRTTEGLLDDTHIQFYGHDDVIGLFSRSGYAARLADRVVVDPRLTEFRTDLSAIPGPVLEYLDRNPHATTYQFIVRAVPEEWAQATDRETPGVAATPAGAVQARLAGELAETERKLANYHEALIRSRREVTILRESRSPARSRSAAYRSLQRFERLKVLYVADRDDAPFRYRCVHGVAQLREAGAVANIAWLDAPDLLERIPSYSIVVLFRLQWSDRVALVTDAARKGGAAVAFEIDDLVFDPDVEGLMPFVARLGQAEVENYRKTFAGLSRTLDAADFCIVTTETLAERARARGKQVLVHPNLLSHDHVRLGRVIAPLRRMLLREPLIGYLSGSNTHDGDLASVAEGVAAALRNRPALSLLLAGHIDPPPALAQLSSRIVRAPYLDHRLYPWIMARCHAVLAPVEAINDFTNSKSALKVFEGGAFGVPAVVSPTAPYSAAVEHGVSGFVASTQAEWTDAIEILADRHTSREMGSTARELALAEHSPQTWKGVLALGLLRHNGHASGPTPASTRVDRQRLRARAALARQSLRLAFNPHARTSVVDAAVERREPAEVRRELARRFLCGNGLEIGALQNPLPLPPGTTVRYVDRLTQADARAHYPELDGQPLVDPSIISEADRLAPVATASEDFVVCNHVLEHMRDPLGALEEWLRVLRPGGHLYVSVPDGKNQLDKHRALTTFEHMLEDARADRPESDRAHYEDWTRSVHRHLDGDAQAAFSSDLFRRGYSIHFHVFDRALFERVLRHACGRAHAELLELVENRHPDLVEYVAVLRKQREPGPARSVDIVVPVYNARAYTRRCVESVLRHATGDWRLVLVDDASTDDGVRSDLLEFAHADSRVVVLQNPTNAGFVATANRGMREAGRRDVLLLNSDTEVFEGFLDRMRAAIAGDPTTGILTPFSNNATICSIPEFPRDNPIPEGYTPECFARLVAACSRRVRPELPTGVGFCMWITAEVLERVGLFDEQAFGRGYGEENDLCQRARKAGFKVRLCDDVFVYHKGKASFGDEGKQLEAHASAEALERKHPGYHAEIARFVASNPLAPLHETIRFHLRRLRPGAERAILFLLHASPWSERAGGTEYHVKDLVRALRLPRAVVAWPDGSVIRAGEVLAGDVEAPTLYAFPFSDGPPTPGARRSDAARAALRRAVELLGVSAAHVHQLLFWPYDILRALEDSGVPFVWTHHDYYAACPNWNLFDYARLEPCDCRGSLGDCLPSFSKATGVLAGLDLADEKRRHREGMDRALEAARTHVFPSAAALEVFERHLGRAGPPRAVIEHGYDAAPASPRRVPGSRVRVALTGEISYAIKGADRYVQLLASTRELPLEWHVFGETRLFGFEERLRALGLGERLVLHGRYPRHALPDLLRAEGIDLCVILPNWDETFSYVLSEALLAGVPALTSARGALRQRITASGAGRAVDSVREAASELSRLCADRSHLEGWTERARAYRHRSVAASAEEHRALYAGLGWFEDAPLEPRDAGALIALHDLASRACPVPVNGDAGGESAPTAGAIPQARGAIPRLRSSAAAVLGGLEVARSGKRVRTRPRDWRNVAVVRRIFGTVSLHAITGDPQMELYVKPFVPGTVRGLAFQMRHELAPGAFAQLFWTHEAGEDFSEAKSAMVPLGAGDGAWSAYEIRLDTPQLAPIWARGKQISRLRLDPISTPGAFDIRRIVLNG